jgi:activator of HSP90 ATPase
MATLAPHHYLLQAICAAVATFVKELHAGTPVESTSSSSNGAAATTAADAATAAAAAAAATANGAKPSATTTTTTSSSSSSSKQTPKQGVTKSKTGGTATLRLTEKFYARASDIYDCFVVEGKVRAFTQSAASVAPQPGGSWSWFGGSIAGTFQELVPNQRLVMSWRFSTWEEGVTSKVRGG